MKKILVSALLWLPALAVAADALPGYAVASATPQATQAGLDVLAAGGNAFDAAVAVSAALAVTEPTGSGLGGGGFWLLHRAADGKDVFVDGREMAPMAANSKMYLDQNGNAVDSLSRDGPLAAGIPGEPAALEWIAAQYGALPLKRSLAPAIRLAREGFPVSSKLADTSNTRERAISPIRRPLRTRLCATPPDEPRDESFRASLASSRAAWSAGNRPMARPVARATARGSLRMGRFLGREPHFKEAPALVSQPRSHACEA